MREPFDINLQPDQAALFFLGQAGYAIRSCGKTVVIDPYLSDSVGKIAPDFSRILPVPFDPASFKADVFMVTHDHLDHLDPETLSAYAFKNETRFVAPRLAAEKLFSLCVPRKNIVRIDINETRTIDGVRITGIHAVPTDDKVADTTGYWMEFRNGRNFYHTSDTSFSSLLLECAPKAETLLTCINGKFGNLNIEEAAELALRVNPRYAIPNHYDLMALNAADPEAFQLIMKEKGSPATVIIPEIMKPVLFGE